MISDTDIERVREATDIVSLVAETVVLRQRGQEFWGCCPFHQEKSPSFHVRPSTGLWKCFGCGKGGDVFKYVMEREKVEFPDAIRYLAERAHIDIEEVRGAGPKGPKRSRLLDALKVAEDTYSNRLMAAQSPGAVEAVRYFRGRGFNRDICQRWKLGYADGSSSLAQELVRAGFTKEEIIAANLASDKGGLRDQFFNRVMFPIHDEQGNCIGFGGRVMGDGKPKYLNTRETPVFHKSKHMFAFDKAKDSIAAEGYAIITEGYMDVISMHEAGFTNTVAALGTALSLDHVKTLSRFAKKIICMFDGDAAGQHAAEAAVRYTQSTKAALYCVVLPNNQDPDEFLKAHGAAAMQEQLDAARPLINFVLDKKLEESDLSSPGLRLEALDTIAKLLAPFKNSLIIDEYVERVSTRLGLDPVQTKNKIKATPIEPDNNTQQYARYDQPSYADTYAQAAQPQAPKVRASLSSFSQEERKRIKAERNFLTLLSNYPDMFRPYADRIADFDWVDERHKMIVWAILATPQGTSPKDAVASAMRVCPEAPELLMNGSFEYSSSWDTQKKVDFVINEVEICSLDRQIVQLKSKINDLKDAQEINDAFAQLQVLRENRDKLKAAQPHE